MRVLMSTQPAVGHFHPMVPLARALEAAGHDVLFVSSRSFLPWIERAGFRGQALGLDWLESAVEETMPEHVPDATDLNVMRGDVWRGVFREAGVRLVAPLVELLGDSGPGTLLVHEAAEWSGPLAAELAGVPSVPLGIIQALSQDARIGRGGAMWSAARERLRLPPDPRFERFCPHLYLDAFPPHLQAVPNAQLGFPAYQPVRPDPPEVAPELPGGALRSAGRPLVYVTLGTVFNRIAGLFEKVFEGLAELDVAVIATVGANVDPARLGPPRPHLRVERYVPQAAVLREADAIVCHGGANTVIGAMRAGVPVLALPIGADHPVNALAVERAGAGLSLDPSTADANAIAGAIRRLLDDDLFRRNAERLASGIAAMPDAAEAVPRLEAIASGRASGRGGA